MKYFSKIIIVMFLFFVSSDDIKDLFYGRINYHSEYYTNNELLKSIYEYFDKIIKCYYK